MRWVGVAALLLAGCVSRPAPQPARDLPAPAPAAAAAAPPVAAPPALPHYRCDNGMQFDVRVADGEAELVFAPGDVHKVLRDAGGTGPRQSVYSSTQLKIEFGLEPQGRGARLNTVAPPLATDCVRS